LIIDDCYQRARRLVEDNREKLEAMAEALLEYETIDRKQIDQIMQGKKPSPPEDWDDASSGGRPNSQNDDDLADPSFGDPAPEH
jgi:cell division protease FtsH